ncbi:MAG: hypothetical protein BWK75_01230 [Candidatus Altiarchaeales archaeon A3]|nr:MAG: hypothetical protein BWK75_01230 [Candidatus Altiarchaeales archaeon A3]
MCNNTNNDLHAGDWATSSGNNNTCDKPDGWNDAGTTGCDYVCGGVRINWVLPLNNTYSYDNTPELKFYLADKYSSSINWTVYIINKTSGTLISSQNGTTNNKNNMTVNISTPLQAVTNPTNYTFIIEAKSEASYKTNSSNLTYYFVQIIVTLQSPANNEVFPSNTTQINFSFIVEDPFYSNLNCSLYINDVFEAINETSIRDVVTNFTVTKTFVENSNWTVNCINGMNVSNNASRNFTIIACSCINCSDCENKLNSASCSEIKLNANITNFTGTCINNPVNFSNKIFDCQGHIISGNNSGIGILTTYPNATVKNCMIYNFSYGIQSTGVNFTSLNNTLSNNSAGIGFFDFPTLQEYDPVGNVWCDKYYKYKKRMKVNFTTDGDKQVYFAFQNYVPNFNANTIRVLDGNCSCKDYQYSKIPASNGQYVVSILDAYASVNYYIYFGNFSVENDTCGNVPPSFLSSQILSRNITNDDIFYESENWVCDRQNTILLMNITSLNDVYVVDNETGEEYFILEWVYRDDYNAYCANILQNGAGIKNLTFRKKPSGYIEPQQCILVNYVNYCPYYTSVIKANANNGYFIFNLTINQYTGAPEIMHTPFYYSFRSQSINNPNGGSLNISGHYNFLLNTTDPAILGLGVTCNKTMTYIYDTTQKSIYINQNETTNISFKNNSIWLNYTNESVCAVGSGINNTNGKILYFHDSTNKSVYILYDNFYYGIPQGQISNVSCENGKIRIEITDGVWVLPRPTGCAGRFILNKFETVGLGLESRINESNNFATFHQCWIDTNPPTKVEYQTGGGVFSYTPQKVSATSSQIETGSEIRSVSEKNTSYINFQLLINNSLYADTPNVTINFENITCDKHPINANSSVIFDCNYTGVWTARI